MSATPEQIAKRLEKYPLYFWSGSSEPEYQNSYLPDEAAALIRAQAERVRVLESAASNLMTLVEPMVRGNTDFSVTWRKYVREMRAALKAAP